MRALAWGLGIFGAFQALTIANITPAEAARTPPAAPRIAFTYADLADLALPAPIVAHVRIRDAIALKGDQATGVPAGRIRYFIEADLVSLIRSPGVVPASVRYLAELPNGSDGATKFGRKAEYLIFASPGRRVDPGELQLRSVDAQIPWSPELGDRVRALLGEANAPGAAPRIAGIGSAFHVPGSLQGESETQLFLQADSGKPISLNVLRRPGQAPQWAVALGEIVDEAAAAPRQNTLLWYRLACGLPRTLPASALADSDPSAAPAIRADYALVLERLGPCQRNRVRS